jgi:hypothetical protein
MKIRTLIKLPFYGVGFAIGFTAAAYRLFRAHRTMHSMALSIVTQEAEQIAMQVPLSPVEVQVLLDSGVEAGTILARCQRGGEA